jgi:Flp pilus assembly protein protease CpaA
MLQTNLTLFAIALAGTAIGAYTDLKTKLVPDWSNYFMLIAGLFGNAIISLVEKSFWPIALSLIGAGAFFGIGYLLYVAGVWGGGDAKLLAAFGALFGPMAPVAAWPFLASLWLNILVFGAIFGIGGMLILLIKNRASVLPAIKQEFKKNGLLIYPIVGTMVITGILYPIKAVFGLVAILAALVFLLFVFKAAESSCLIKTVKPSSLVEGDWIAEQVSVEAFTFTSKKSGITKAEIAKLVELEKSGKLKDVKIKDGIPYVPAFLAALITTVIYGDLFYKTMMLFFNHAVALP